MRLALPILLVLVCGCSVPPPQPAHKPNATPVFGLMPPKLAKRAALLMGPRVIQHTNRFYFVVTGVSAAGLESVYSSELAVTNIWSGTNQPMQTVTLGWTPGLGDARYNLYYGGKPNTYTNAVLNIPTTQSAVVLIHPIQGFYVTLSVTPGQLNFSTNLVLRKWAGSTLTSVNLTNGLQPGLFIRGSNGVNSTRPVLTISGRNWFSS